MDKKPVLVILAAGMGSRYGGLKQIDPVDDYGNLIIDFSIYDAKEAGFEHVIFIIKKSIETEFKDLIGDRIANEMEVSYAYQEIDNIPENFIIPEDRIKPWGTGHALLCAKSVINSPFAVINADDYYGKKAFKDIFQALSNQKDGEKYQYVMAGYQLSQTLTEYGHVARGICTLDDSHRLRKIQEKTRIEKRGEAAAFTEDDGRTWNELSADTTVSMNFWGFTESILNELEDRFEKFLSRGLPANPLKGEFFLPSVVDELLHEEKAEVTVLPSFERWYGVTYKEDKGAVVKAIHEMKASGQYPEKLWETLSDTAQCARITDALKAFQFTGTLHRCERYGNGHINDTFRVDMIDNGEEHSYILQRINHEIFRNPKTLMKNITRVTEFLRERILENNGNPERETLNLIPDKEGNNYFIDVLGNYWRAYLFITDADCFSQIEKLDHFYESAKAFGRFQKLLSGFPGDQLYETILDFHNTPLRMETLKKAIREDICGRAAAVENEIRFIMDRESQLGIAMELLHSGALPLRVTHNDTKLNNVMIDCTTEKGICVIDLDTVMPGLSIFDFGDAIRFGANMAAEDETELSKVSMSLPLFELYVRGFMEECGSSLTTMEIRMMPMGAKLMTLECGIRFLTDYLQGDTYFRIHRENHNLDRTRVQLALVKDMENKWKCMEDIVDNYIRLNWE